MTAMVPMLALSSLKAPSRMSLTVIGWSGSGPVFAVPPLGSGGCHPHGPGRHPACSHCCVCHWSACHCWDCHWCDCHCCCCHSACCHCWGGACCGCHG